MNEWMNEWMFINLEYIEVFEFFGQNKNGCISTKQLRQAMRMIGLNPTDHQIQHINNEKEYDGKWLINEFSLPAYLTLCISV